MVLKVIVLRRYDRLEKFNRPTDLNRIEVISIKLYLKR